MEETRNQQKTRQTQEDRAQSENDGADSRIRKSLLEIRNQDTGDDKSGPINDAMKPCFGHPTQRKVQHRNANYSRCGQDKDNVASEILAIDENCSGEKWEQQVKFTETWQPSAAAVGRFRFDVADV